MFHLKGRLLSWFFALVLLPVPVVVAAPPPPEVLPLSQIIQKLEQRGDVAYFDEIEWEKGAYWEVEYITPGGQERKIRVDPVSGEVRED